MNIFDATINGNLDRIKYLIENGTKINSKKHRILRLSAEQGNLDIVKYVISKGSNINAEYGYPLIYSARNGHIEVVKYLIEKGADIYDEALIHSALNGHIEVVKYLIENGANIHTLALHYSIFNNHFEIVKYLISKRADIYATINTIFRITNEGRLDMLELLIENGFNIHIKNFDDESILSYVTKRSHNYEVFRFLLQIGADIKNFDKRKLKKYKKYCSNKIVLFLLDFHYKRELILNQNYVADCNILLIVFSFH